ncbi:hypothetical protein KCTCHS21_35150 [Cohnella abietis]|uniref:Uncharacterized protein n=1 Tax=Cohnella abietis TaxID=2507935 RepID=A0A3T1D7Q3_9BACL|nr:hypothetical protein KCTCHS21_35150 [Cohnella abietis]
MSGVHYKIKPLDFDQIRVTEFVSGKSDNVAWLLRVNLSRHGYERISIIRYVKSGS